MKRLNDLDYLKLNKFQAFWYNFKLFFLSILPGWFKGMGLKFWKGFLGFFIGIKDGFVDIGRTFKNGNWAVKLSFLIFGFGNFYYGQILRGAMFLLFEIVFLVYMFLPNMGGLVWLQKAQFFNIGDTIGNVQGGNIEVTKYGETFTIWVDGDDSVRVLFYALLTVFFVIGFIYTWRLQVKQCRICMDITAKGKKVKSGKDDLKSLLDDQFHKTLLSLPVVGIGLFTVLPIVYMIIIAFTNYGFYNNKMYDGRAPLFEWVGGEHFEQLTNLDAGGLGAVFGDVLIWTLTWSFFATFTNYFFGMMVAMLINKKGIKIKKFWRTVLVMTIAIPQFVSLLYVRTLFTSTGVIGKFLDVNGLLPDFVYAANGHSLWDHEISAKILLIVINIWIGIPYVMLMATGILMNIPEDLYESSKVDGANGVQQFMKITLPYMLFVTGPYLLTSFVGNLNNFNVIYFLSGGGPLTGDRIGKDVVVGHTDLLINLLFKLTTGTNAQYYMASLLGILIFVVVAFLSLIVYNVIPSTRNEEDYK